jgi:hypothetical protein
LIKAKREDLGTFTNESGVFVINDVRDYREGTLSSIKKGLWYAYVDTYDDRNLRLIVRHEDCKYRKNLRWEFEGAYADISTGYVGIFDSEDYQGGEDFYDRYSINEGDMCGKNFVKCMTGLGDGSYDIIWHYDKNENIDAVVIEFLDEEWFEE